MKRFALVLLLSFLSACAPVKIIESGEQKVGARLRVNIEGNWNHFDWAGLKPATIWTMEGISVDQLLIYTDIKDGTTMHPEQRGGQETKNVTFRSSMTNDDLVSMFEAVYTRDGSTFKLMRAEPYRFGGCKGVRFDYERTRKHDHLIQTGVGFAAVDKGELFALIYQAPRLTFFPRHKERVEAIAFSAAIL